jgi:hypothetical protein
MPTNAKKRTRADLVIYYRSKRARSGMDSFYTFFSCIAADMIGHCIPRIIRL